MTDEEKKAKAREYNRKYRETHREEIDAARRLYYKAHRKELNAKNAEWQRKDYAKNPEKYLAKCRKWQAENPEYVKAYHKAYAFTHARKARQATAKWRRENYEYKKLYGKLYTAKKTALKKGNLEEAAKFDFAIKQAIAARKITMKGEAKS